MSTFRFASLPSSDSVAAAVTLAVSAWLVVASGSILADRSSAHAVEGAQHGVLMEEAAPAYPTPIPVAAAATEVKPVMCERILVEAQRIRVS